MGKPHSFSSSYYENPGKDLLVLAESTLASEHSFHKEWLEKKASTCQAEMIRAAGIPSYLSGSSRLGNTDDKEMESTPANVLFNLRKSPFPPSDLKDSIANPSSFTSLPSLSPSYGSCKQEFTPPVDPGQLNYFLAAVETVHRKESQLLEQFKGHLSLSGANCFNSDFHVRSKQIREELQALNSSKMKLLNLLAEETQYETNSTFDQLSPSDSLMTIFQQPSDVTVANRYLSPAPIVEISSKYKLQDETATLIVSATLFYHSSEKDQIKPLEGKQEVLQGISKVPVDKNGQAIFGKLKITEVSSKHRHQAFCLVFSLEEYSAKGKKHISSIKSESFYVQSRPNNKKPIASHKRKSEDEEKERKRMKNDYVDDSPPSIDSPSSSDSSPQIEFYEGNYVDITDLLTLPQKNAAQQLGISESMLCKRFKECTKRKWPYRYLRKIDKVISMLTETKNGRVPHSDDKQKLARLVEERKECLRPVKIRITVHDKLSSNLTGSPYKRSAPPSPSHDEPSNSQFDTQDEIVLASLEMLKSQK